jgi:hypothetical protein
MNIDNVEFSFFKITGHAEHAEDVGLLVHPEARHVDAIAGIKPTGKFTVV